jgi:hypothetical protein
MKIKAVYVEWLDSHSFGSGTWARVNTLKKMCKPDPCYSVGWLLEDKEDHIMLSSHLGSHNPGGTIDSGAGDMCIPKKAISKMRTINVRQFD